MIVSFGDRRTEDLFNGRRVRGVSQDLIRATQRKLAMVNYAVNVQDLRVPPGNKLEQLRGDLAGFWSIRVNDQWRLIFRWDGGAHEVSLVDYH